MSTEDKLNEFEVHETSGWTKVNFISIGFGWHYSILKAIGWLIDQF